MAFVERYVTGRILVGQKYTSSGGVVVYFSNILKPRIFSIEIWKLFVILSSINLEIGTIYEIENIGLHFSSHFNTVI